MKAIFKPKKERTDIQKVRRGAVVTAILFVMALTCIILKPRQGNNKPEQSMEAVAAAMDAKIDSLILGIDTLCEQKVDSTTTVYEFQFNEQYPHDDSLLALNCQKNIFKRLMEKNDHFNYDMKSLQKKIDILTLEKERWETEDHTVKCYYRNVIFSASYRDSLMKFSTLQCMDKKTGRQELRFTNFYKALNEQEIKKLLKETDEYFNHK